MYFDQAHSQVLSGIQTQLTQPYNPLHHFDPVRRAVFSPDGSAMSFVGKVEPIEVLAGRQSLQVGQLRITNIRQMRLRDLTHMDVEFEGCRDLHDFTAYWILRYGRYHRDTSVLVYNFALVEVYSQYAALSA